MKFKVDDGIFIKKLGVSCCSTASIHSPGRNGSPGPVLWYFQDFIEKQAVLRNANAVGVRAPTIVGDCRGPLDPPMTLDRLRCLRFSSCQLHSAPASFSYSSSFSFFLIFVHSFVLGPHSRSASRIILETKALLN